MKIEKYTNMSEFASRLKLLLRTNFTISLEITPAMAQLMLVHNTGNRPVHERRTRKYAKDMRESNWVLTGEPIIFADDGTLNNGQHRLLACIAAETAFQSDVRFGISRHAHMFTDLGAKRSQADALAIHGEKYCTALAASLAWIHRFQRGLPESARDTCDIPTTMQLLEAHPAIRESVAKACHTTHMFPGFQAGPMGFVHYAAAQRNVEEADSFFERIRTGFGINSNTDPIYRLRQRISQTLMSRIELRPCDQIALSFKAWNALRQRKPISQLSWRTEGAQAESFPEPI